MLIFRQLVPRNKGITLLRNLANWPIMLRECRKVVNRYEPPQEDGSGLNSSFLRQSRAQKYGAMFQNVIMASLHLRAMLYGSQASGIPDLPQSRSAMVTLFGKICNDPISPKDVGDWPQPGVFRAPLQLAALISPIVLLSQIRLDSSCFDKEDLLNVSLILATLHTDTCIICSTRFGPSSLAHLK